MHVLFVMCLVSSTKASILWKIRNVIYRRFMGAKEGERYALNSWMMAASCGSGASAGTRNWICSGCMEPVYP